MQKDIFPIVDLSLYTDNSAQAEKMFLKDRRHTALLKALSHSRLRPKVLSLRDAVEAPPQEQDPLVVLGCRTDHIEYVGKNFIDRRVIIRDGHVGMHTELGLSVVGIDTMGEIKKILHFLSLENRRSVALYGFSDNVYRSCGYVRDFIRMAQEYDISVRMEDVFWNSRNMSVCFEKFSKACKKYNAVVTADSIGAAYLCIHMPKMGVAIPDDLCIIGRGSNLLVHELTPRLILMKIDNDEMDRLTVSIFKYLRRHPEVSSLCMLVKSRMILDDEICGIDRPAVSNLEIPAALQTRTDPPMDMSTYRIHDISSFFMNCDATDRTIVQCLQSGYTIEEIADKVFLSCRGVSYRIKKILQVTRTSSREELLELLADFEL